MTFPSKGGDETSVASTGSTEEIMFPYEEIDNSSIMDLLFDTNLTNKEIAEELCITEKEVVLKIKQLGLGWLRKRRGHASRGQAALAQLMRKLLPGEEIICEYQIGELLRIDVYCPKYKLAAEFHGRQHFEYVDHFHHNQEGFTRHKERDLRKETLCREKGIALVVFRYNDMLTEEAVFQRLLAALHATPTVEETPKQSIRGNPYYEAMKSRQREYRKMAYRKMKGTSGRQQRKTA